MGAVANRAHAMRTAGTFGIVGRDPEVDPRSVNAHVKVSSPSGAELLGRAFRRPRRAGHPRRRHASSTRRRSSPASIVSRPGASSSRRDRRRRFRRSPASTAFPTSPTRRSSTTRSGCTASSSSAAARTRWSSPRATAGSARASWCWRPTRRWGRGSGASRVVLEHWRRKASACTRTKVESVEGGLGRVRVNVSVGGEKHVVEGSHLLLCIGAQAVGERPWPRGGGDPLRWRRHQGGTRPQDVQPARVRHRRGHRSGALCAGWPTTTPASSSAAPCSMRRRGSTPA